MIRFKTLVKLRQKDVVNPQAFWRKLKQRLRAEENETVTNCHGLKMITPDGKMRLTDVDCWEQAFKPYATRLGSKVGFLGGAPLKGSQRKSGHVALKNATTIMKTFLTFSTTIKIVRLIGG